MMLRKDLHQSTLWLEGSQLLAACTGGQPVALHGCFLMWVNDILYI